MWRGQLDSQWGLKTRRIGGCRPVVLGCQEALVGQGSLMSRPILRKGSGWGVSAKALTICWCLVEHNRHPGWSCRRDPKEEWLQREKPSHCSQCTCWGRGSPLPGIIKIDNFYPQKVECCCPWDHLKLGATGFWENHSYHLLPPKISKWQSCFSKLQLAKLHVKL